MTSKAAKGIQRKFQNKYQNKPPTVFETELNLRLFFLKKII